MRSNPHLPTLATMSTLKSYNKFSNKDKIRNFLLRDWDNIKTFKEILKLTNFKENGQN